jgi:putative transcriptional regulator
MKEHIGYAATRQSSSERQADFEPDLPAMTAQELANAPRVPRVKTLRRAMRMTQEAFAAAYAIPLGTLRDWEQGATEPDAPARAYLRAIAGNPEAVLLALRTVPPAPAAGQ